VRHFLLNEGAKLQQPTAIPYLFHDRVMHPMWGVWTTRVTCRWCDLVYICHPQERLTAKTHELHRWMQKHRDCDARERARQTKEAGRDLLRRELGTTHFHKGL
jgi:hypothetical protein